MRAKKLYFCALLTFSILSMHCFGILLQLCSMKFFVNNRLKQYTSTYNFVVFHIVNDEATNKKSFFRSY